MPQSNTRHVVTIGEGRAVSLFIGPDRVRISLSKLGEVNCGIAFEAPEHVPIFREGKAKAPKLPAPTRADHRPVRLSERTVSPTKKAS